MIDKVEEENYYKCNVKINGVDRIVNFLEVFVENDAAELRSRWSYGDVFVFVLDSMDVVSQMVCFSLLLLYFFFNSATPLGSAGCGGQEKI